MMPQASFDFVAAGKQAGVAVQRVEQQPLVRLGHRAGELACEAEIEIGQPQLHAGVGHLGLKVQLNAFGRLNLNHQPVGVAVRRAGRV